MMKIQVLSCSYDITSMHPSGTDGVPPYVPPNETVTFTVACGPNWYDANQGGLFERLYIRVPLPRILYTIQ